MGAELNYEVYDTQNVDTLKDLFGEDIKLVEDSIINEYFYEYPGEEFDDECLMYTGTIHELHQISTIYPIEVKTIEEAEEVLMNEHQKWNNAMVVKIKGGQSIVGGWCSS